MATITRLDKGKYEVRYDYIDHETGKRKQGKRRFDAYGTAKDFVKEVDQGYIPTKSEYHFSTWIDDWFSVYKITAQLEHSTISSYEHIIIRLKQHFGMMRVDHIKPMDVERLYLRMMNPAAAKPYEDRNKLKPLTDKPLSSSTCQRHHAVLHRALTFALRDGIIKVNPLDMVDRPKSSTVEIAPPAIEDIAKTLNELRDTTLYLPVCLAVFTGARQSEILGLRWDCVDMTKKKITVKRVRMRIQKNVKESFREDEFTRRLTVRGMEGWYERDRTKAKHSRTFSIPDELITLIKKAQHQQKVNKLLFGADYIDSDYVCTHEDGRPIGDGELSHAVSRFRFHDLRHANASYLIDAGVPMSEISRRLGHTSVSTTTNIYAHSINKQDEDAAEISGSIFPI